MLPQQNTPNAPGSGAQAVSPPPGTTLLQSLRLHVSTSPPLSMSRGTHHQCGWHTWYMAPTPTPHVAGTHDTWHHHHHTTPAATQRREPLLHHCHLVQCGQLLASNHMQQHLMVPNDIQCPLGALNAVGCCWVLATTTSMWFKAMNTKASYPPPVEV